MPLIVQEVSANDGQINQPDLFCCKKKMKDVSNNQSCLAVLDHVEVFSFVCLECGRYITLNEGYLEESEMEMIDNV